MTEIVVPPASGAASALGFLAAPVGYEVSRSLPMSLADASFEVVNELLAKLETECRERLNDAGVGATDIDVMRFAEMRLQGQMHEISVPLPDGKLTAIHSAEISEIFATEYSRLYTHLYDGARIEIINWRVRCEAPSASLSTRIASDGSGGPADRKRRPIYCDKAGAMVDAAVFDRYRLTPGMRIEGPAVVEEAEATTIIPTGATAAVDDERNLCLSLPTATAGDVKISSDMALDQAMARIAGDPINLEIMWSRMINIAEECWHTVIRTAFSLIIGEAQDFACEILDAKGRQIVHSPRAMPVFNLTLPMAINAMIEKHPPQTLREGDVLITNDPWLCAGHLFDIAIAVPVFRSGRVVAFVGIVGHVTDIGGTKDDLNAREIYDEGLQIPPMKLFKAGEANEDLFTLIGENVRRSDQVLGDIHALVAAGVTGAARVEEFMSEYGIHDLEALASVVQERAETAMRTAIADIPDGVYRHQVEADGIGETMTYPIKITIRGETVDVDFEGAPPQTDRGGSNCTLSYTKAHATYPLKCIFTPEVPGNAGCYVPMSVSAPKGSILNCEKPKAVNTRVRTGWYIAPNVFAALAEAAPNQVQAFTGLPSSALFYGVDGDGETYSDHLFQGGGQGGSGHGDGVSGLLYPTSAANTSIELFETRVPALVTRKEFLPDTGGPGRRRGGLSQIVASRKLYDDGLSCQVGLYPNGVRVPIDGLFGGRSGGRASAIVVDENGQRLDLGVGGLSELTKTEEVAELVMAGGSGYGDPWSRDLDDIQRDLDDELITPAGARQDYGCVVREDGRIDRDASETLRAGLSEKSA